MLDHVDWEFLFHSTWWQPQTPYVPSDPQYPQVMFTMRHAVKPETDLLRGEALEIVSAMVTRLERSASDKHQYVPVRISKNEEDTADLTDRFSYSP